MGKPIYRMSEAGKCPRALSAMRLGYEAEPKPEWLERTANEGNWHEQRIIEELRADDIAVVRQQEEVKLDYPLFTLIGHIEGTIYDHKDTEDLFEVKSMSQFEFDRWMRDYFRAFPHYADQLALYMEGSNLHQCLYIVKNRNNGYLQEGIPNL